MYFYDIKNSNIGGLKSPGDEGEIAYVLTELPLRKKMNQADIDLVSVAVDIINGK